MPTPTLTAESGTREPSTAKAGSIVAGVTVPVGGFSLAGPSRLPDPRTHAYRQDLADAALAGTVIASHYAEPLERRLSRAAVLFASPKPDAEPIAQLAKGDLLLMLDCSRDWAWGYAGPQRLVGYLPFAAL